MMSLVQTSVETTIRTLAITNTSLIPSMAFEPIGVSILSATIGIKCLLSIFCYWVGKKGATINPSVIAYADDHRNDVFTNSLAMLMWGIATIDPSRLWFTDPLGAVLICLYVIVNWQQTASEQIANLVSSNCVKVTIRKTHHCVASCVVYYKCFFSSRWKKYARIVSLFEKKNCAVASSSSFALIWTIFNFFIDWKTEESNSFKTCFFLMLSYVCIYRLEYLHRLNSWIVWRTWVWTTARNWSPSTPSALTTSATKYVLHTNSFSPLYLM